MRPIAYWVRHGDTDLNDQNVFRGDEDIDLNARGRDQADKLVKFFKHHKFARIYSSDRKRVRQTMLPLAKDKGMRMIIVNNLESLNTGDFTNFPKSKENVAAIQWYSRHPDVMIPGGESFNAFRERVDPVLWKIIKYGEEGDRPTIVGVHGSILKELHRLLYGTQIPKARVETGGVEAVFRSSHGYEAIPILGAKDSEDDVRPGS